MIQGQPVVIGASIGIAVAPGDGDEADKLLKNADLALYRGQAATARAPTASSSRHGCARAGAAQA